MSDDIAIKVENVSKDFSLPHLRKSSVKSVFTGMFDSSAKHKGAETQHALKDISFEVKKGEFFGIVGRNGSGKSTLLKILAGIYQPTKGSTLVKGKLVPFIELGVGFNPELTGRENVYLNGALLGFSKAEVDRMYDEVVEFAELEKFMDQKLKNYSSGMQVRLAFSMAIRANAEILLIDEVLAVGDADFQRKCFSYFKKLKAQNVTVVFVTHDMDSVREYCDRALLIENSLILDQGKPDYIATKYSSLFTQNSGLDKDSESLRWGDQKIVYDNVSVVPQIVKKETSEILIRANFTSHAEVSKPIFGFRIKAADGKPLLGSNTKIMKINILAMKRGKSREMTWRLPNIFSDGKYSVDMAISHSDGVTQCDWWEHAAEFTSYRESKLPYDIEPKINLEIGD